MLGFLLIVFDLWSMGQAHKGFDLTYVNRTDGDITMFVNGEVETIVPANGSQMFGVYDFHWEDKRLVEAKDESGTVLFSARLSKEDLQRLGYRIVIAEEFDGPAPLP
jgi:hypothetical protein